MFYDKYLEDIYFFVVSIIIDDTIRDHYNKFIIIKYFIIAVFACVRYRFTVNISRLYINNISFRTLTDK